VEVIPGTQTSGANGIAVSGDGRWLFVASFGTGEVIRFDRSSTPPARETIPVGILPDNIRWTPQGTLYAAGNNTADFCGQPPCAEGWSVVEITPYTLVATRIAADGGESDLRDASSALRVGDEIWVGTYGGDRLAIVPAPQPR
jgi:DNA-binding beta-propeller fold protein YncE